MTKLQSGYREEMTSFSTWVDSNSILASDTLLHAIDIIEGRLMEFPELRQTIGKDFMFYLQINLRKLKDDPENDACRPNLTKSDKVL
jgi:hypothetical protein